MSRKGDMAALAAILLLTALLFADILTGRNVLFVRDFARSYVPERAVLHDLLRSGSLPMWNPRYAAGQPLAANPNYELFYPPQWLVALPSVVTATAWEVVLHFLLAELGMYSLLRTLGLRLEAAAFGTAAYALGGLMMSMASLLPCLFALAWWPWLAQFAWRYLEERRPRDFVLAALALGMILLVGEPAMILETGVLLAGLCAVRARLRGLGIAAAICAAALAVGSVQIIPALDLMRDTPRGSALPFSAIAQWSLSPARPIELAFPEVFSRFTPDGYFIWSSDEPIGQPWIFNIYLGLLTASLVIAGFIRRIRPWRWIAGAVVIAYLLALGRHLPLLLLLYRIGANFIRYPEKFFMAAIFLLVIFAAIAADAFLADARFRRTTWFVSIALAIIAIAIAVRAYLGSSPFSAEQRGGALTMVVFCIVLAAILMFRERPRLCLPLLAIFIVADLGSRSVGWAPRVDRSMYDPPPIAATFPPRARIYNDAEMMLSLRRTASPPLTPSQRALRERNGMWPEMAAIWGFDSVLESDVTSTMLVPTNEFRNLFREARLSERNDLVPMLTAFAGTTDILAVNDLGNVDEPVRAVAFNAPRAYFAAQLAPTQRIRDRAPWPPGVAFVDKPFVPAAARILRAADNVNDIDLDVEAAGNAALVLSVTPHRYWRATIDGAAAPLYHANVGFQALTVPRGRHHVSLRYRNPLVIAFGIVSLVSVAILAAGALRSRAPRPPSPR